MIRTYYLSFIIHIIYHSSFISEAGAFCVKLFNGEQLHEFLAQVKAQKSEKSVQSALSLQY